MYPSAKSLGVFIFALGTVFLPARPLTEKQAQDAAARVDALLAADLKAADVRPMGAVDDGTFLRRAYLGIIGRIPTEEEGRKFLEDASPEKREALVDALVGSPGFDSHLFNWAADLLRIQTNQEQFGLGWHVWLRKSLAEDKPWDAIVREMLGSTGHAARNPAVAYYLRDRNMQLDNFSNSMQVFLGRQIGCAQCHDHPFDEWTQHEYYQMAAFGGGISYRSEEAKDTVRRVSGDLNPPLPDFPKTKEGAKARREAMAKRNGEGVKYAKVLQPVFSDFNKNAIYDDAARFLHLPEDYQYADAKPKELVAPETLFGVKLKDVAAADRRQAFADWVTARENPYFTKVIANRMWARTFGHGLQDPVDDWNDGSKPAHPQVLAYLETAMKGVNYDLRQFSRILFRTRLFQRECDPVEPEPGTAHLVRGPALQRMSAEQIYDSLLVLNHGEVDDSPLAANADKWENYTATVEKVLHTGSAELVAMGEAAAEAEKENREYQSEVRRLRAALGDAKDDAERKTLAVQLREAQRRATEARRARDPVLNMSRETAMTMEEGEKNRRGREGFARNRARASELPAPFNPASLVREFGGSDRTTPSSGDTVPTVPQALALLNDPATDIIGGKRSALGQRLAAAKTPQDRLEILFLRLYGRLPDSGERERFIGLAEDGGTLRELARAMLTSNQFIFVQ